VKTWPAPGFRVAEKMDRGWSKTQPQRVQRVMTLGTHQSGGIHGCCGWCPALLSTMPRFQPCTYASHAVALVNVTLTRASFAHDNSGSVD
jgi:hypothetical protein